MTDLNKARERDYPKRCQTCWNFESLCRCIKIKTSMPRSGVPANAPRRVLSARWN